MTTGPFITQSLWRLVTLVLPIHTGAVGAWEAGAVSISVPLIGLGWFSLDGEAEGREKCFTFWVLVSPPALLVFLLMPRLLCC